MQQSPNTSSNCSNKNKSQVGSNPTSSSLLLNHYGEVNIEPEPIDVGEPLSVYNPHIHHHGGDSSLGNTCTSSPPPTRGAPQAYSPLALHSQTNQGRISVNNNSGMLQMSMNNENMSAPTPLDHLMHSLQNDIAMAAEGIADDLNESSADNIDMSMYASTTQISDVHPTPTHILPQPTTYTMPSNDIHMQNQFVPYPPPPLPLPLPEITSQEKKPFIKVPIEIKNESSQITQSGEGYLTIPQAIQLVQLQELKKQVQQKKKSSKRKLTYGMYSSVKYHHLPHVQNESFKDQDEMKYTIPTAAQITAAIPSDASSIFHIFDRRINFDSLPSDATNYSLLRRWVQDDPYRKDVRRLPNLMDHVVLPSQQRKILNEGGSSSGSTNSADHNESVQNEGDGEFDVKKQQCDVLGSAAINSSSVLDMKKYLEDHIAKGAMKRKSENTALKKRDQVVLKRLERTLGIKVKG